MHEGKIVEGPEEEFRKPGIFRKAKNKKENYVFSLQGGRDSGIEDPHQTVCFL